MLHFDDVLKHILGEFGKYQIRVYILMGMWAIPAALHAIAPVFLLATTDAWCRVPGSADSGAQICLANVTADCEELVKNLTIPRAQTDNGCGATSTFSQCYRYNVSHQDIVYSFEQGTLPHRNDTIIKCDHGWEYDRSQYKSTVFQQFDLVCDDEYLGALASSFYMLGFLIGSFVFGIVLDKFGRKRGFLICVALEVVFGVITAFAPNYWVFAIGRLCVACTAFGAYLAGFVLATEMVGPSKRTVAGMAYSMFFGVGYMLLALYGYLIRDWQVLQLVLTVPAILFLSYWWLVPESPRWLLSVGRNEEAERIIRKCGRVNKVPVPDDIFSEQWNPLKKTVSGKVESQKGNQKEASFLDLFRLPNMRKKTLILFYNWFVNTLVYYGLAFNTSNLGGNDYINCFVAGAVEIPAYLLGVFIMDWRRLGRRWSMFYTMVIGGIACICAAFVPPCGNTVWIGITLATISKFSVTCSFGMVYVYSAELFPTPLRSVGIGLCSMCARLGGIIAPQLLLMANLWAKLPPVVFGAACILAGILILPLPETRGKRLPETLEEGERFGKTPKKKTDGRHGYGEIYRVKDKEVVPMEAMIIK